MKKRYLGFVVILAVCLCAYFLVNYFLTDDELNPKALQWLDEYETLPDLQSNVYIHLMSLTKEGVKNKDEVIANYLRVLKNFKNLSGEYVDSISFLNIPDVENSRLLTLNCLLNESGCIEKLI